MPSNPQVSQCLATALAMFTDQPMLCLYECQLKITMLGFSRHVESNLMSQGLMSHAMKLPRRSLTAGILLPQATTMILALKIWEMTSLGNGTLLPHATTKYVAGLGGS